MDRVGTKRRRDLSSTKQAQGVLIAAASVIDPTGTVAREAARTAATARRVAVASRKARDAESVAVRAQMRVMRAWAVTGRSIRTSMTAASGRKRIS